MIDTTTLDESTFSLTYPAPAQVIGSNHLISGNLAPSTPTVTGTWSFSTNSDNQTVAVFTPDKPLQQNTLYTAMLLGSDAALTSSVIKNLGGESMAVSYSWGFTTGVLNLQTPPPTNQVSSSCRNQIPSRAGAKGGDAERRPHAGRLAASPRAVSRSLSTQTYRSGRRRVPHSLLLRAFPIGGLLFMDRPISDPRVSDRLRDIKCRGNAFSLRSLDTYATLRTLFDC